jgi:hypothetical protein
VQEFGRVRDLDEVARRERAWEEAVRTISYRTGREVASIPAPEFRKLLAQELDLRTFEPAPKGARA